MGLKFMDLSENYDVFKYNRCVPAFAQVNELTAREFKKVSDLYEKLLNRLIVLEEDLSKVEGLANAERLQLSLIKQAGEDVNASIGKHY